MKRSSLYFVAEQQVNLREEELAVPAPGEVQVRSLVSAVSAGTELMIYTEQAPQNLQADTELAAFSGSLAFPLKYGYSIVGEITELGEEVEIEWKGKRVFAFNPHESAFNADVAGVQPLPEECEIEDAVFLANMETAVSLVQDGRPLLGEKVVVLGQGVVGLLTTAILARFPLDLFSVDARALRREFSNRLGAKESFAPDANEEIKSHLGALGADLVYELTGRPEALNIALDLVGEHGRIVVGSWYGTQQAHINLGEKFHRGRIKIVSSQVSQIEPGLRGRWGKARRFAEAWKWLQRIKPSQLVTHRFDFEKADEAYQQLLQHADKTLGVLFTYKK